MTNGRNEVPAIGTATSESGTLDSDRTSRFSSPARRFDAETFRRRREHLLATIDQGVAVLFGAKSALDSWEERRFDPTFRIRGFRQEPNFFYLTGLEVPGAAVVLDFETGELKIFVPEPNARVREQLARLDLGDPLPLEVFEARVRKHVRDRLVHLVVRSPEVISLRSGFGERTDFPVPLPGSIPGTFPDEQLAARFEKLFEPAAVRSLVPALLELRRSKEPVEIEAIREAARATVDGFLSALPVVAPNREELEVAAALQAAARRAGAQRDAFMPLVQSGVDGLLSFVDVVDAYDSLNQTLREGQLALLDYGGEVDYYVADLARTVPVSGRFSEDQRTAYQFYLRAYRAGIEAVGPGRPFMDAARATADAFADMLPELPDWLRPAAELFASNGGELRPGHFLGLELHDHEHYRRPLQPGEIVAYEHHLRIPERGWRITVEDMLLITEDACENLTERLPREPDEIEEVMERGSRA